MNTHTLTFTQDELKLIVGGLRVHATRSMGSAWILGQDLEDVFDNLRQFHEQTGAASYELSERLYELAYPQTDDEDEGEPA